MLVRQIGIDLGTTNTVVYTPGKGFVINEPTIVALSLPENKVLAVGHEAKEMIAGRPATFPLTGLLRTASSRITT
jgi:rod shape-determining protein MreB